MVNRRTNSDASTPLQSVAPVVKRKRRASCLGEQERRERKRAIDREAQRSLREKTKTHIAELERTIEILRSQDSNGATASLLSEIEGLRAENERLKDVIDGVRSVVGGEIFGRTALASTNSAVHVGGTAEESLGGTVMQTSSGLFKKTTPPRQSLNAFEFSSPVPTTSRTVDLDGMNVMPIDHLTTDTETTLDLNLALDNVEDTSPNSLLSRPDSPATAAFGAQGPDYGVEAGMLYRGIKDGWDTFNEWMQSPVLQILKAVDRFLFVNAGRMERLAAAYKSFKLLKFQEYGPKAVYRVTSPSQSSTTHPIAIDFFAWRPLRDRLVHHHSTIFRTSTLSKAYANHLRFDWPFSFQDTFYYDEVMQAYYPSPLFEKYHGDVKYWTVDEGFFEEGLEEMRGDIDGVGEGMG
ncbi:hypothetical protein N0V90_013488 [Kalmusia sp. IMI 367209]|nr:hypothetical protein N0V90_013488 [Kalmusia sp. IMI 367209]